MPYTTNNIVFYFLNKQNNSFKKEAQLILNYMGNSRPVIRNHVLTRRGGNKHSQKLELWSPNVRRESPQRRC